MVIPDQTGHSCFTEEHPGHRAAGTECQDADEVLLLNECLITNDSWPLLPSALGCSALRIPPVRYLQGIRGLMRFCGLLSTD